MDSNAFVSLSKVHLPSSSRFVASSCCPDKDLVVCLSRLGSTDRISLWNSNQGFKIWDVGVGEHPNIRIVDIAWSPDGQSIAVAHDPFQISIHSLQDGLQQIVLPNNISMPQQNLHIKAVWWFQDKRLNAGSAIPDIFRRGGVVTGTSHAILQSLPLLDNLQEDSDKLTATDLFAFQGSQTRSSAKSLLPEVISGWPMLSANPLAASIRSTKHTNTRSAADAFVDALDDSNMSSILVVTDDHGHIHFYLDGTFPLGIISLGPTTTRLSCLFKHTVQPVFYGHRYIPTMGAHTDLRPISIAMPLLGKRHLRELAKLSSTTRELVWYTMRVVKEMRTTWFGSESSSGAREFGPQWVRALEAKQKGQFGQEDPNPILDLTRLLVSGRASEPLLDFLGSGEQMSERALQKWEATVTEALVKLRECSEKSVSPACQRLHLVLEELRGWAQLPQYRSFQLSTEDLDHCLELTRRSIIIASWLAAVARRELSRFKDFISWLRFETSTINSSNESTVTARHDILEVNNYFISGLVVSSIDKWFLGPVPHFHPRDLGIPGEDDATLLSALERARTVAGDPDKLSESNIYRDISHLDRNLDALIQELAMRCQRAFTHASGAPCRSAVVSLDNDGNTYQIADEQTFNPDCIKERTEMNESDELIQHIALCLPSETRNTICIAQHHFKADLSELPSVGGIALLECCLPEEVNVTLPAFDLLEVEFFDGECVVIVYRLRTVGNTAFIATLNYNNVEYQRLNCDTYVSIRSREALFQHAVEGWRAGQLIPVRVPIKQCRALAGFTTGNVTLAVNGRAGRRVACVLDSTGTVMESFDLEGDVEDMEVADDGREP